MSGSERRRKATWFFPAAEGARAARTGRASSAAMARKPKEAQRGRNFIVTPEASRAGIVPRCSRSKTGGEIRESFRAARRARSKSG